MPTPEGTAASPLTERERSDQFFRGVGFEAFEDPHPGTQYFDSLQHIATSPEVDLIVRGRILDVEFDERDVFNDPAFPPILVPWITVSVEEVLRGVPARTDTEVEIHGQAIGLDADVEAIEASLPDHEVLLFLANTAAELEWEGEPPFDPDRDWYTYAPVTFQGILRNIDGRVSTIPPVGSSFPSELEGEGYDEVVQRVRDMVADGR